MVTNLPAQTRERIDEIRTFHVPAKRSWWRLLRPVECVMCGVPIGRCQQLKWAEQVASGERPPAGWIPQQRKSTGKLPVRDATWWEY